MAVGIQAKHVDQISLVSRIWNLRKLLDADHIRCLVTQVLTTVIYDTTNYFSAQTE
jgi:hypothetical protein